MRSFQSRGGAHRALLGLPGAGPERCSSWALYLLTLFQGLSSLGTSAILQPSSVQAQHLFSARLTLPAPHLDVR